jgi:hypothetical protein
LPKHDFINEYEERKLHVEENPKCLDKNSVKYMNSVRQKVFEHLKEL